MKPIIELLCVGSLVVGCGGSQVVRPVAPDAAHIIVDACRLLTSWHVAPLQASAPNGTIDVSIVARDPNGGGGVTYLWTATAGVFANSIAPTTQYRCTKPGAQTLTGTAFDKSAEVPCQESVTVAVMCKL